MQRYIARRLLQAVLILFVLSVVVFVLLHLKEGADPAQLRCGLSCTPELIEANREELGLNDSWPQQYWSWVQNLFSGSLGTDWQGLDVSPEFMRRLPVTAELLIITVLVTTVLGVPFGVISAIYRNSPVDYFVRFFAVLGLAVPAFWLATLVLLVPQDLWGYAPPLTTTVSFRTDPWDNLRQFLPPAIVLGVASSAGVMRLARSAMLEVMRQDYIRTARAKGLRETMVIGRHALKNSLIPVTTVLGLQVATLFGGAVIVEQVFNLRGLGFYFFQAIFASDFQVVQTLTIYTGAAVVLMNLAVDVGYAWLDPRIRYS